MTNNEACIVRPPLAFVLHISRVMGLAPLDFQTVGNGYKITVSRKWTIYSYILITMLNISNLVGSLVDYERRAIKFKTFTTFVFVVSDVVTASFNTGFGVYNGVRRMKLLINNLSLFEKVRTAMNVDYDKRTFENKAKFVLGIIYLLLMILYLIIAIWSNMIHYPNERFIVSAYGIFYMQYFIQDVYELQIIFTLLEVRSVLRTMCDKMNGILALDESENVLANQELNKLGHTYVTVCEVTSKMNHMDGSVIVLIFGNFVTSVITTGYYGDVLLTGLPLNFAFIQLSWCCIYVMRLLVLIETCHLINKEVNILKVLTGKMILKTTGLGKSCPFEVDRMFKHLLLNKPTFTPMGFFTLNRSFIITIFSAIITYLLFMIQFKWSGKIQ